MTDNEIIVPLKCLVMNESDCRHCKLKDKNDKCQKFLYSDVLGLIEENNRQKADKETMQSYIDCLKAEIKELESEIDRQYEQAEADILGNLPQGGESCHWCIDKHKAYAIKEFAERLKEKSEHFDLEKENFVSETDIDNLVKEMVGEG